MSNLKKKILTKTIGAYINGIALFSPKKAAEKAYNIFCTPRIGKLKEKQIEFLETATRWTNVDCDSDKIQCYEWEGTGEKVLLAHGWESNSARWKNLIKSLQKANFHIIAMDAPAHGGSGSESFQAVKYAYFMSKVVAHFQPQNMVGHSVGGYAMLYFLTHYPQQVQKAVVLGSPSDLSIIMKNYQNMMGYSNRVMQAVDSLFLKNFGQRIAYFKIHEFVKALKIKGLVIHGEDDLVCPFHGGKSIQQNWEGSEMIVTDGLGHGYQDKKVYHAIRDFLKSPS